MEIIKKFVSVIAVFEVGGKVVPKTILWEDGRKFDIDYIMDIRKASSQKVGGIGIRYICKVRNRDVVLFKDDDEWWMEAKSDVRQVCDK